MKSGRSMSLGSAIRRAQVVHALTRWETATTIGMTIFGVAVAVSLARIATVPSSAWLAVSLFGATAMVALVISSLADPASRANVARDLVNSRLTLEAFRSPTLRAQLVRAVEYRVRIEGALSGASPVTRAEIAGTTEQIDGWLERVHRLAGRVEAMRVEADFQADEHASIAERVDQLEAWLAQTIDASLAQPIRETLAGLRHRLRTIEALYTVQHRAELRFEQAVGALGTVYTQVALFSTQGIDASDARQLAREIDHEVEEIDSVLTALDRVYGQQGIDARI